MSSLDTSSVPDDLTRAGRYAAAALHALAREEAAGRRKERLLEPELATWRQFRGRMDNRDLLALLLEDACVTQPFAFDARRLLAEHAGRMFKLTDAQLGSWLAELPSLDLDEASGDYVRSQAEQLGVTSRLARSDLHRGVQAHHKVLELPGTGGQLSHYLASELDGIFLQDVFTIAWAEWADRALAGFVAVENELVRAAPIAEEAGLEAIREAGTRFDYVIGAKPEKVDAQPQDEAALQALFPDATVVLV